jgi:hypothetical protein
MKAKKVFEKFEEESDPIKDMDIGIFCNHVFEDKEEFYRWFFREEILSAILEKNKIPKDILYLKNEYYMKREYWNKLSKFIIDYIRINNKFIYPNDEFGERIVLFLLEKGFKIKHLNI